MLKGKRCFSVNGFTIHANRYLGPQERTKLEELLAYGARGAFSNQRLSLVDPENPTGDLQYSLKRAWSDRRAKVPSSSDRDGQLKRQSGSSAGLLLLDSRNIDSV